MKYAGMPRGMWMIFHKSFQRNLTEVLKYDEEESRKITALAKKKYRELIERLIVTAAIRKSRPLI